MIQKYHCNIKPFDVKLRYTMATILFILSLMYGSFIFAFMALFLFYTAIRKFCPMYYILKINERYGFKNYYLSLLPKYRKTPVFIFDEKGKIVFQNDSSHTLEISVQSPKDLEIDFFEELINAHKQTNKILNLNNRFYQIDIQGLQNEKLLLAYFDDVTEVMKRLKKRLFMPWEKLAKQEVKRQAIMSNVLQNTPKN
jgi:hypothetical protein